MPTSVLYPEGADVGSLVADIDWATGPCAMFMTYEHWQEIVSADLVDLDEDGRFSLEVLTHEAFHLLHMVTTGFAYGCSTLLFKEVVGHIKRGRNLDEIHGNSTEWAEVTHA